MRGSGLREVPRGDLQSDQGVPKWVGRRKRFDGVAMRGCLVTAVLAFVLGGGMQEGRSESPQQAVKLQTQVPVTLDYLLYLPPNYDQQEKWPLLLFLHGAGERGTDVNLVKMHGPPKLIDQGKQFPFIVLSPQCPKEHEWEPIVLTALLDEIESKYKVDRDRVYVTGLSMGGFGTFELAAYTPNRFAALMPLCPGGGEPYWPKRYAHVPVWLFQGAKDNEFTVNKANEMAQAIRDANGFLTYTIYPNGEHNIWTETYNNPAVYEWLLHHKRQPRVTEEKK